MIGGYLSPYINPGQNWIWALTGLFHIWLLLINLFFGFIWLFIRWKISLITWSIILIGIPVHQKVFSPIHVKKGQSTDSTDIKVMTYNVQLFKLYNWTKNTEIRDQMIDFIDKENCDVICFQEYFHADKKYFNTTDTLKEMLTANNIHFEAGVVTEHQHEFGLATFSRFPIVGKGVFHFDGKSNKTNMGIYTDLEIHSDTFRIYNIHLASNHLDTREVDDILEADKKSMRITKNWLKKIRNGYKLRSSQLIKIKESISLSPHPVILCGDFNDVPVSYTYQSLSRGLTDAFIGSGEGLGATYNGKIPNLRIDYILHSPELKSSSFKILHKNFTDHFPVICTISIH